jgi:hypothetical protein
MLLDLIILITGVLGEEAARYAELSTLFVTLSIFGPNIIKLIKYLRPASMKSGRSTKL